MRFLVPLLLLSSLAYADQRQRPVFMATTTFESCTTSWALACNMPGPNGTKFGTAHEMKHCERFVFQPDGTFTSTSRSFRSTRSEGTYRIFAGKVRLVSEDAQAFELVLSVDGTTLGNMKRLPPR